MQAVHSCKLSHDLGISNNRLHHRLFVQQYFRSIHISKRLQLQRQALQYRYYPCRCNSFLTSSKAVDIPCIKNAAIPLARSYNSLEISNHVLKLIPAVGIIAFGIWGLGPLLRKSRNLFLHKSDSSWGKSRTHQFMRSYLQPLVLWTGAMLFCRALDPMELPTEAIQIVKQQFLKFIRSLSTVLAFAYCFSSVIEQVQKFFMDANDPPDTRNMGFQFAGTAVYYAGWVAAVLLSMELLGFSSKKLLTAGGLGTVLLSLAGRELLTNFLSSVMIHATRPFVVNDVIKTTIAGTEVSGAVERVGWWSPTIIRGEDREAVYIPNYQFTVNIVRNNSHKSHWRIKAHLAISHLDFRKINSIVADMRKVLAKNPQVEQKKLHRRVFLDYINPENQAMMEAVLLDLLRVIRHHKARLATPIYTMQRGSNQDVANIPYVDPAYNEEATSSSPMFSAPENKDSIKSGLTNSRVTDDDVVEDHRSISVSIPDSSNPRYNIPVHKQLKKRSMRSDLSAKSSAFEDNIVLGVALKGSKHILPIEEVKEFAIPHNCNGSEVAKIDNHKNESPDSLSNTIVDKFERQD